MGLCLTPPSPAPDVSLSHKGVDRFLSRSRLLVSHLEKLPDHLHNLCLIHLSNGARLISKTSPPPETCLLRTESTYLDNEAIVLELLVNTGLPVPRLIYFDRRTGRQLLLTAFLPGTKYAQIRPNITKAERANVENQIGAIQSQLGQLTSDAYGPVGWVKAGQGFGTWREAFTSMFESILMDGEDMLVHVPYFQIREAISRWESYLEDVTKPRLVVRGLSKPENVLIDRKTKRVTGLLDFGQALWADAAMNEERRSGNIKGLL